MMMKKYFECKHHKFHTKKGMTVEIEIIYHDPLTGEVDISATGIHDWYSNV